MGDISLELWMERRKLAALENALANQGMTVKAYMQAQLEKAYQAFVPQETQQFIQAEIMQEEQEMGVRREASRRFAVFRVREGGAEMWFSVEDRLEFLHAANHLRNFLHRRGASQGRTFSERFSHRAALSPQEYDSYVSERLENTGRVTGAFEIDFDRGICSALSIMDGWKAYPIKDVCAAAFQAYRKEHATEQERWQKFLGRLDGRELTLISDPNEDIPFHEQPEPSMRGL